jgi:hypothetical protein
MAKRTVVVDDIDGSTPAETVTFALDDVTYSIDLSRDHAAELRDSLAKWIAEAEPVSGRRGGTAGRRTGRGRGGGSSRRSSSDVRQWAREQGYEVSDRGRIPANVLEAYEDAHR